jgi:hypothetical protein
MILYRNAAALTAISVSVFANWARKVGNAAGMATSATELSAPAWH